MRYKQTNKQTNKLLTCFFLISLVLSACSPPATQPSVPGNASRSQDSGFSLKNAKTQYLKKSARKPKKTKDDSRKARLYFKPSDFQTLSYPTGSSLATFSLTATYPFAALGLPGVDIINENSTREPYTSMHTKVYFSYPFRRVI